MADQQPAQPKLLLAEEALAVVTQMGDLATRLAVMATLLADQFIPSPDALDGKFHGMVIRNKDDQIEPPDGYMVFCARDDALPRTLIFYLDECRKLGAAQPQLDAVMQLIQRVEDWRAANPEKCHVADVEPGELSWKD